MFKTRKDSYKFTGKSHSIKGMVSTVIGGVSFVGLLTLFILSGVHKGNGSIIFGIAGMILFVLSFTGFVVGVRSCLEKEIYYTAPITGMSINGILTIILFILYVMGIFM